MCKGLAGAKQGWEVAVEKRKEVDAQGANDNSPGPPGKEPQVAQVWGSAQVRGAWLPTCLGQVAEWLLGDDSLEFPCGSGRLLRVAGACNQSVTVAGAIPQLSGHSSGTQTDCLWPRVFCSWVRPPQPLSEWLWSQGWAFKRDPRTGR